jgi:V/A-type H+-transporting ATPase subunit I
MALKPIEMKKFTIIVLDEQVDSLVRLLGNIGIAQLENVGEKIQEYEELIEPTEPGDFYYRVSSALSQVEGLIGDLGISNSMKIEPKEIPEVIDESFLNEIEESVRKIEKESLTISKELEEIRDKYKITGEDVERTKILEQKKIELANRVAKDLLIFREILRIEQEIEEVKALSGKTERSYVFEGWVEAKKVNKFEKSILETTGNNCILKIESPRKKDDPPILLKNPKLLKPVEILTVGFSIPNYREIDPTLLASISFPIFFGIMFADIGHGFILLIPALMGFYALKTGKPRLEGMVGWWVKGSPLLIASAISSIFFGVLFGEMLGFEITAEPLYIAIAPALLFLRSALTGVFQFFDYDGGVKTLTDTTYSGYSPLPGEHWVNPVTAEVEFSGPILFSPFQHPFVLFALSILIGVIQISIGLLLGIINLSRRGKIKEAIVDRAFWLWFYLGIVWLAFNRGVSFTEWFTSFGLLDASFWGFGVPLGSLILGKFIVHRNLIEGFIGTFEVVVASISNTISYTRILALNQVHAGFSKTFVNLGAPLVPSAIIEGAPLVRAAEAGIFVFSPNIFYVIFMLLQIGLVMFLEGLLTFINTLRLHWVEWFLKFYEGGGTLFKPFSVKRAYTIPKIAVKKPVEVAPIAKK